MILVPSLALLFGLVLRGRFDAAAAAAAPTQRPAAASAGRGRGRAVAVAGLIVLGVPLTLLADGVLFALGVVLMLAFVAAAFALLVSPEALDQRDSG